MEWMGLVSRLEQELERMISSGTLPAQGQLPSEQVLARRHGVSRATLREALRRLAARGLVVQYPGRRTRAVALDQAVSLENVGVVLHGEGGAHPGRRRLLEGYFALKRKVTVELLSASCTHATDRERRLLQDACFALSEAARWEADEGRWVALEFELLRLAARVADRPEYFLLVQSLERACQGMAGRVLPHLDAAAIHQWARCALHGLGEEDPQALQRALRPLLQAADERVLGRLAPAPAADDTPAIAPPATLPAGNSQTESARLPGETSLSPSACLTGSRNAPPQEAPPPETSSRLPTGSHKTPPQEAPPPATSARLPGEIALPLSACLTGSRSASPQEVPPPATPAQLPGETALPLSACLTGPRNAPPQEASPTRSPGPRRHHRCDLKPLPDRPSTLEGAPHHGIGMTAPFRSARRPRPRGLHGLPQQPPHHVGSSLDEPIERQEQRLAERGDEALSKLALARKVRHLREQQDMSQEELASRVNTRQSAIARLESGKVMPRLDLLQRIAAALGMRLELHFART
jgi:GntR family transcriptional regulator, transcriptional repressor for pyruvate dehydrogenase complex